MPDPNRPTIVGIAGFPLTGKTTLAKRWISRWPTCGVHLPTESVILSRTEREAAGLDGCNRAAHRISDLAEIVGRLCRSESVRVPVYAWADGAVIGTRLATASPGSLVVIDGSIVAEPEIAALCDHVVFAIPCGDRWFEAAVARDVEDRHWEMLSARRWNRAKVQTVVRQYDEMDHPRCKTVGVDGAPHGEVQLHSRDRTWGLKRVEELQRLSIDEAD